MEGFGYAPAEALVCGCPTICADNSSLREVVLDPVCRFSTNSTDDLERLLQMAAQEKLPLNSSIPDFSTARAGKQFEGLLSSL
jgi:glycosyltransferase involved in cell wall biosynthesis